MNSKFYSQLEVFVAITRHGSIVEAANSLRISKSNASQKLMELELDLDLKLFHRTTRKLALTTAGKAMLDRCENAVDIVSLARSELGGAAQQGVEISGVVTLAGSNIYLTEYIMPKLSPFLLQYPKIRLRFVGGDHPADPQVDGIDLRVRVGEADADGAKTFPLKPIERVLCVGSPAMALVTHVTHPKHLADLPLIMRVQEKPIWVLRSKTENWTFETSPPQVLVNSYELCVQATRNGYGLAVLAKEIVDPDLATGKIIQLLPDWHIDPLPVALTAQYSKLAKPHVKALAMFLAETLK
ncbi:MAG: LysR family transcriptional regulator [Pelagimonas sp.]|uniref:LysR family transcriptional regulator n=1 Tax=Pelagimonas sp. TaxID=2073170 RepID=UPI003D6B5E02